MSKNLFIGEVLSNQEVQTQYLLMKIRLPLHFDDVRPGQFVMIRIAGLGDPFLSRPISVYAFARARKYCTLELLFRVVGKGTQILAGLIRGSQVEIHGPLGSVFPMPGQKSRVVFIAGGIGVAPLSLLTEHLCRQVCHEPSQMSFYLGAQSKDAIVGLDKLEALCYDMHVCTDDGSAGKKNLVTRAFAEDLAKYPEDETIIYACGPKPMLRALADILKNTRYECAASLEERMACGVGACVGCVAAVLDDAGLAQYRRVCVDGPVFDLKRIVWDPL